MLVQKQIAPTLAATPMVAPIQQFAPVREELAQAVTTNIDNLFAAHCLISVAESRRSLLLGLWWYL